MHAVFKTEGNDATERQHQEQCQNSQSFVRNRLAKTFPTVKTPAKCGFTPGMLSERETRYLSNQNEFWHHLWCLGDLRGSGGGFDGGVEYIVVLRHHNKEPCMNPATQ